MVGGWNSIVLFLFETKACRLSLCFRCWCCRSVFLCCRHHQICMPTQQSRSHPRITVALYYENADLATARHDSTSKIGAAHNRARNWQIMVNAANLLQVLRLTKTYEQTTLCSTHFETYTRLGCRHATVTVSQSTTGLVKTKSLLIGQTKRSVSFVASCSCVFVCARAKVMCGQM